MRDPIDKEIGGKVYRLTKFYARAGREIFAKYPLSALPKIGDYTINEEVALKILSHVYVEITPGNWQALNTWALIDNHVPSWETQLKIEAAILEYNCTALQDGRILKYLTESAQKLPQWITKILTDSLQSLSAAGKPLSES